MYATVVRKLKKLQQISSSKEELHFGEIGHYGVIGNEDTIAFQKNPWP